MASSPQAIRSVFKHLASLGIEVETDLLHVDLAPAELVERALSSGEGNLAANGALVVETGSRTGRSPNDRFVVDDPSIHDNIAWGKTNVPISRENYSRVRSRVTRRLSGRKLYVVRGYAGAARSHSRKFLVVCERASQALFVRQMLVRPTAEELESYGTPDFTVLAAPGCMADPISDGVNSQTCVALDFASREVMIAGTAYSGEIKKAIFSVMNYLLPVEDNVLPMHCSANLDPITRETAVLFGLSGTGKTTLSADPTRRLIGDDEHGWAEEGVFNIEGGCYAKCDNLSEAAEPEIYNAVTFGSICENVIVGSRTREPDYTDVSLTENTRVAYPVDHIPSALDDGLGSKPSVVLFLACDAFGVLPPISRLSRDTAMYHFIMGFTSKVAGTEQGIDEPQPTFSALFGEPFMPLDPMVYAKMLGERIDRGNVRVYLLNTGWQGGPYGVGHRIDLGATRALVSAALTGVEGSRGYRHDPILNLDIPIDCPGVSNNILDPREAWTSTDAYDQARYRLATMFVTHANTRFPDLDPNLVTAGPHPA